MKVSQCSNTSEDEEQAGSLRGRVLLSLGGSRLVTSSLCLAISHAPERSPLPILTIPISTTDVRTSDFSGGNVPNAVNVPSRLFDSPTSVRSVISTHILPRLPELKLVLTHCMRSQYRGPMAAQELANHETWPKGVEVMVMEGGFLGWRKKFQGVEGMIEGLPGSERGLGREDDPVEEQHSVELRQQQERQGRA